MPFATGVELSVGKWYQGEAECDNASRYDQRFRENNRGIIIDQPVKAIQAEIGSPADQAEFSEDLNHPVFPVNGYNFMESKFTGYFKNHSRIGQIKYMIKDLIFKTR